MNDQRLLVLMGERAAALDSVVRGESELFMAKPETGYFLVPIFDWIVMSEDGVLHSEEEQHIFIQFTPMSKFYEFLDGKAVASAALFGDSVDGPWEFKNREGKKKLDDHVLISSEHRVFKNFDGVHVYENNPYERWVYSSKIPFSDIERRLAVCGKVEPSISEKKRSRSDAVKTAIEAYLDKCDAEGKNPILDECWRFVSEYQSIDVNLDGVLTYPMYDGKVPGKCTRKQLSGRLGRAKKAR